MNSVQLRDPYEIPLYIFSLLVNLLIIALILASTLLLGVVNVLVGEPLSGPLVDAIRVAFVALLLLVPVLVVFRQLTREGTRGSAVRLSRLRQLDPETEGMELLLDLLERQGYLGSEGSMFDDENEKREAARSRVALPPEVNVVRKRPTGPWRDPHRLDLKPVGWNKVRETHGAPLVLDRATSTRVSVLCTRESVASWQRVLLDFPIGEYRPDDRYLRRFLNSRLTWVSPYSPEDEEEYRAGWRCSSLLEVMHLLLWLDLRGGHSVRECGLHDCTNYFRVGSQKEKTRYCSAKHASLASTRMNRGQKP